MDEATLHALLKKADQYRASDILLKVGQPPAFRVGGDIHYVQAEKLRAEHTRGLAEVVLKQSRFKGTVDELQQFDSAYSAGGVGRYRVNVYRQRGSLAIVMRNIPLKIPVFDELRLPPVIRALAEIERGMILVVGATGSGKSSTLAAMIGHINQTKRVHIVTIEDPIEFLHQDAVGMLSQREIGIDTPDFAAALRAALRQDPDTILVGEIRDHETMDIALKAAETGHLLLSTLHTPDVTRTVGRVVNLVQNKDASDMRERLADNLRGIVAQRLLPRADGAGMVVAVEILVVTGTARETIRRPEGNVPLRDVMEKGVRPYGMQTFDMAVRDLLAQGIISQDTARIALG